MELEIFTLADHASDHGRGKLTIDGTFDTIFSPQLPYMHPHCSIAARMRIANSEAGKHEFEIRALAPDGKVLHSVKGNGDMKANPHNDYSTHNFVMNLNNLKLDKAGKYAFEFYFDGEFRSGLKLNLVHAMPPGMVKAA